VSHVPRDEPVQLPAETYSRLSSDGEDNDLDDSSGGEKPGHPYVNFHPRPAAVSRQVTMIADKLDMSCFNKATRQITKWSYMNQLNRV